MTYLPSAKDLDPNLTLPYSEWRILAIYSLARIVDLLAIVLLDLAVLYLFSTWISTMLTLKHRLLTDTQGSYNPAMMEALPSKPRLINSKLNVISSMITYPVLTIVQMVGLILYVFLAPLGGYLLLVAQILYGLNLIWQIVTIILLWLDTKTVPQLEPLLGNKKKQMAKLFWLSLLSFNVVNNIPEGLTIAIFVISYLRAVLFFWPNNLLDFDIYGYEPDEKGTMRPQRVEVQLCPQAQDSSSIAGVTKG